MQKVCGIYRITAPSGNFYVGSSADVPNRWRSHLRDLRGGKHHAKALQRAADRHGIEALQFEILCECPRDDLRELEELAIVHLGAKYNSTQSTRTPLDELWKKRWFREKMAKSTSAMARRNWADPAFRAMKSESSRVHAKTTLSRPDVRRLSAESSSAALREKWRTDAEYRKRMSEAAGDRLSARWESPEFQAKMVATAPERGRKGMLAMRSNPENIEKIRANARVRANTTLKDPEVRARNAAAVRAAVSRKVQCIDTGEVFESIKAAAIAIGAKHQCIQKVVSGKGKTYRGMRWRYFDDAAAAESLDR